MKLSLIVLLTFIGTLLQVTETKDFRKYVQSFVLETKDLSIPGYPGAFNPSITRWESSLLLSFRIRDPLKNSTCRIGFVFLDLDFNLISEPQEIFLNTPKPSFAQDPRLIVINDVLYMVYSNMVKTPKGDVRRVFYTQLQYDGKKFTAAAPEAILNFPLAEINHQEKNWVPFDFCGNLLLAYSIIPHRIMQPLPKTNSCQLFASTKASFKWDWGGLRGGTPALLVGNEYLAFFHCSKSMESVHSDKKNIPHYFMGAYTFDKESPFSIRKVSPEPIFGADFYTGPAHKPWKPLRVVFPGGFVFDDQHIWVVYGRQDFEVWVVKLEKKGLLNSLKEIK